MSSLFVFPLIIFLSSSSISLRQVRAFLPEHRMIGDTQMERSLPQEYGRLRSLVGMRRAYRFNTSLPAFLAFLLKGSQIPSRLGEKRLVVLESPQPTVAPRAEDAPDLSCGMVMVNMGRLSSSEGDWFPADGATLPLLLPERHKLGVVQPVQVLSNVWVVLLLEAQLAAGSPPTRLALAIVEAVQEKPIFAAWAPFLLAIEHPPSHNSSSIKGGYSSDYRNYI